VLQAQKSYSVCFHTHLLLAMVAIVVQNTLFEVCDAFKIVII
jgi:hypothetical protein